MPGILPPVPSVNEALLADFIAAYLRQNPGATAEEVTRAAIQEDPWMSGDDVARIRRENSV